MIISSEVVEKSFSIPTEMLVSECVEQAILSIRYGGGSKLLGFLEAAPKVVPLASEAKRATFSVSRSH